MLKNREFAVGVGLFVAMGPAFAGTLPMAVVVLGVSSVVCVQVGLFRCARSGINFGRLFLLGLAATLMIFVTAGALFAVVDGLSGDDASPSVAGLVIAALSFTALNLAYGFLHRLRTSPLSSVDQQSH